MLKSGLLGAAILIGAPALAQTQAPTQSQTMPAPATVDTAPVPAEASPAADPTQAPSAEHAASTQPAPAEQVASVVDQQFATYDKDADGTLTEAEFGAWMVAVKSQTDPKIDANAPATKQWNKAAFAQADKDKSRSLSKTEVTGFLTPAKS